MKEPILENLTLKRLKTDYPDAWGAFPIGAEVDPNTTIGALARSREMDQNHLLFRLNRAEGLLEAFLPKLPPPERARLTRLPGNDAAARREAVQERLAGISREKIATLDVRPILAGGVDPFQEIQAAREKLPEGGALHLLAPFEPLPLYPAMAKAGFEGMAYSEEGIWHVFFLPGAPSTPKPPTTGAAHRTLDCRDLEAPLPLQRILETVAELPPGGVLEATLNRRPELLFPRLEERGLAHETIDRDDRVVVVITRPSA